MLETGMARMVTDRSVMSFAATDIADARYDALLAMIEEERGLREHAVQEIHTMLLEVFAALQPREMESAAAEPVKQVSVEDGLDGARELPAADSRRAMDNRVEELELFCKSLKEEMEQFVRSEADARLHEVERLLAERSKDVAASPSAAALGVVVTIPEGRKFVTPRMLKTSDSGDIRQLRPDQPVIKPKAVNTDFSQRETRAVESSFPKGKMSYTSPTLSVARGVHVNQRQLQVTDEFRRSGQVPRTTMPGHVTGYVAHASSIKG